MLNYSNEYIDHILRESEKALSNNAWTQSESLAPYFKNLHPSSSEEERHNPNVKVTGSIPV